MGKSTQKKILSQWSKEVKKKMIDQDMDMIDVANKFNWTRQYVSSIINGGVYYGEAVARISLFFDIEIPSENATLAKKKIIQNETRL